MTSQVPEIGRLRHPSAACSGGLCGRCTTRWRSRSPGSRRRSERRGCLPVTADSAGKSPLSPQDVVAKRGEKLPSPLGRHLCEGQLLVLSWGPTFGRGGCLSPWVPPLCPNLSRGLEPRGEVCGENAHLDGPPLELSRGVSASAGSNFKPASSHPCVRDGEFGGLPLNSLSLLPRAPHSCC